MDDQTVKNNEIGKTIQDVAHLYPLIDQIPNKIEDKIVLTVDVNPNFNREIQFLLDSSNAGSVTTSLNADTYITNIYMSDENMNQGSNPANDYTLFYTSDGVQHVVSLWVVGNAVTNIQFPMKGIRLKRGSLISFGVQSDNFYGFVAGYTQDTTVYGSEEEYLKARSMNNPWSKQSKTQI